MDKTKILILIIGILAGFIAGFLFANSQNKQQITELQSKITTPNNSPLQQNETANSPNGQDGLKLSKEEIRGAIAKADEKPTDVELQRKLGMYLYQYAMMERDTSYLPDVARLLKRAAEKLPKDHELIVTLGNVIFDMGETEKNPKNYLEARGWYQKALAIKADDPNVYMDVGRTYYYAKPSEPEKAIVEYRKSLAINPKHELTLQSLAEALIAVKKYDEAQKRIEELKTINPSNQFLTGLEAQLSEAKVKAQS